MTEAGLKNYDERYLGGTYRHFFEKIIGAELELYW